MYRNPQGTMRHEDTTHARLRDNEMDIEKAQLSVKSAAKYDSVPTDLAIETPKGHEERI